MLMFTKEFLYYAVKEAIEELYKKAHGTGMVHVTKPVFEGHEIALPPLNEQRRIVAKLEKLLGIVDACQKRLEKIPLILKRFRQSVLAAACSGRLTADWSRSQNQNKSNYLCEGDLLFTRLSDSIEYVANCAIVRNLNRRRIQYPDRLFCAKLISPLNSTFCELVFAAPFIRAQITEQAKSSAGHQR